MLEMFEITRLKETRMSDEVKQLYVLPRRDTRHGKKCYLAGKSKKAFYELYPITPTWELVIVFGVSRATIDRLAKLHGLQKNMDVIKKIQTERMLQTMEKTGYFESIRGRKPSQACVNALKRKYASGFNPLRKIMQEDPDRFLEIVNKRNATRAENRRKEALRIKYGLERKTNHIFSSMTKKAVCQKFRMIRYHNYFADENNPTWVCFDSDTERSERMEESAEKKGLKVINAI